MKNSENVVRKVILHIGMQKTGSTAIQQHCHKNRGILKQEGLFYPAIGNRPAHNILYQLFERNRQDLKSTISDVFAEFEATDAQNLLISSESLSIFGPAEVHDFVDIVSAFFEPYDVKILVYLRRQDQWIESLYNQVIKGEFQYGGQIEEFMRRPKVAARMDYEAVLAPWAATYGANNIIVRVFDKELCQRGIVRDFMESIGIVLDNSFYSDVGRENESLDRNYAELIRYINANKFKAFGYKLVRAAVLQTQQSFPQNGTRYFLSPSARNDIIAAFKTSNAEVAKIYLGRGSGQLFDKGGLDTNESWSVPAPPPIEELQTFLINVINIANNEGASRKQNKALHLMSRLLFPGAPGKKFGVNR